MQIFFKTNLVKSINNFDKNNNLGILFLFPHHTSRFLALRDVHIPKSMDTHPSRFADFSKTLPFPNTFLPLTPNTQHSFPLFTLTFLYFPAHALPPGH